jgi:hypothetical protein
VTVSAGIISTIAGNGGSGGFSGDNGYGTSAALHYPYGVGVDTQGITFITLLCLILLLFAPNLF